jgi:type III secretion protein D
MYELRILSGLHRGATLPLEEYSYVIGAGEDADVVLVDPEIEPRHATLTLTGNGWTLAAEQGVVRNDQTNDDQAVIALASGHFARVGGVWVTVTTRDARWSNPPPEPADELFDANNPEENPEAVVETPRSQHAMQEETGADAPAAAQASTVPKVLSTRRSSLVLASFALIVIASAAGAYAITSGNLPMRPGGGAKQGALRELARGGKAADPTVAQAFDALNENGSAKRKPTPEELRKAFRKRLADADLLRKFDLALQDDQWSMQASLDEEETQRFEHILAAFFKANDISIPVHATIGNGEALLPFKIRQVISGRDASVVTQDGDRLYVGDEFRGVRLVAIKGSRLTFAGKRKIEVVW